MELAGIPVADLTPAALVGLFVVAILVGLLVPRRTLKDVQTERDTWKEAYHTQVEARGEEARQMDMVLAMSKANHELLVAISKSAAAASGYPVPPFALPPSLPEAGKASSGDGE